MDAYNAELERVTNALRLIPGKLSEDNVKRLGVHNHFETFEDQFPGEVAVGQKSGSLPSGKRLSLSGSTVVIDIDFSPQQQVENVSVSLSSEVPADARYSPMASVNSPDKHLLSSLREPRLDKFAQMLAFLSRCDRFSTKDVDCFRALDMISEAIHIYVETKKSQEFGTLVVNPPARIGLGMLYYGSSNYAYLDVMVGSRRDYCLRMFSSAEGWLDTTEFAWKQIVHPPEYDTRAEIALSLDPPIVVSEALAHKWKATISNDDPFLEKRKHSSTFSVPKHARFSTASSASHEFDTYVGNMLSFRLVEINQLPISGPGEIPDVIARLRQFALMSDLVQSLLKGPEVTAPSEISDLNIADALTLIDQPINRKRSVLNVAIHYLEPDIIIDVSWVLADLQMIVTVGLGGSTSLEIKPETPLVNMADINRLVAAGNLAFAISYALSSYGRLRRRSTASFSG